MTFEDLLKLHGERTLRDFAFSPGHTPTFYPEDGSWFSRHPQFYAYLSHSPTRVTINNVQLPEKMQGRGHLTRLFARHLIAARKLGVREIALSAVGRPSNRDLMGGYYAWPRLGFDDPQGTFGKLFRSKAGREGWREHGTTRQLTFDTDPDSPHSRRLMAYLQEKGIKV